MNFLEFNPEMVWFLKPQHGLMKAFKFLKPKDVYWILQIDVSIDTRIAGQYC